MEIVDGIFGGGGGDGGVDILVVYLVTGVTVAEIVVSLLNFPYTFLIFPWNAKLNNDITLGIIHALYPQTVIL